MGTTTKHFVLATILGSMLSGVAGGLVWLTVWYKLRVGKLAERALVQAVHFAIRNHD